MKKLIILVLTLVIGVIVYLTNAETINKLLAPQETTQLVINETTVEVTTIIEDTTEETTGFVENSLFNEQFVTKKNYPLSTRPENIPSGPDLLMAVDLYYQEAYSYDLKKNNQSKVSDSDLTNLEKRYEDLDLFNGSKLTVDQVSLTLDGETVYIPRIIVPITYQNAEKILTDNDIPILNEAMTHLGNRLIMIGYYNPQTKQVTVYHLTNWTLPLFTYSDPVVE